MNVEVAGILNNDKNILNYKDRFNYHLILKCIENTNNLSNNCLIHFNITNHKILENLCAMLFYNKKTVILNTDYKNNCSSYLTHLLQSDFIENNIELIINNNNYNFYSLVYLSNISIDNNVINIEKIKLYFDYFKNKIVNNGIIIFDNIDSYEHNIFLDKYIKSFNYVVFFKSHNKIAYIKKFNCVYICSFPKTGTCTLFNNFKNSYNITQNHSLLKLKYILSEQNNLIIVGIRNPIDTHISNFFQSYNCDFNDDVEIKKNNYTGINNYCCNHLDNLTIDSVIDLFKTNTDFHSYNDWLHEFFEIIKVDLNYFTFNIDLGYDFYHYNNNTILMYTLEKLNTNINKFCDCFNLNEFKNYNEGDLKIYKDIYKAFKNKIKIEESTKNTILDRKIFSKFYNNYDLDTFYNKY